MSRFLDLVLWALFGSAWIAIEAFRGVSRAFGGGDEDSVTLVASVVSVGLFVVVFFYEVLATQAWGRTLGKRFRGLRVVCRDSGLELDLGGAVARGSVLWGAGLIGSVVAALVGVALPMLGGIALSLLVHASSLLDRDGRGWHDKVAGTAVVEAASVDPAADQQRA